MTALKSIIAEAKKIRKKYPKKEWKDCVKQASAIYASKHKTKTVGAVKKAAKKKVAKKKTATKKSSYHKDTKSHNVNIRVVSGVRKKKISGLDGVSRKGKKTIVKYSRISGLDKIVRKGKKTNVHYSRIMGIPSYSDPDAAREIELYADNDSRLYFSRKLPILKNLQKKFKKGTYDIDKAAKLWRYYIDDAMQRYNKEFGSRGNKWYELLSTSDRQLLALEYAKDTLNEFEMGNFIVD